MIRLATRASKLALWQAGEVKSALGRLSRGEEVVFVTVRTHGDELQDHEVSALGTVNVFTAEVDRAVAEGRADAGVHSLKDLGTRLADGLVLAAVLDRGPVEDVLIAPRAGRLTDLPPGAAVGTGSPRRRAMVLRECPDLRCVNLRGNVETRLAKVERGEVDAAILARAGIERLGLGRVVTEVLSRDRFLPAAGQGTIGITCRAGDARIEPMVRAVRHEASFAAALAERAVLRDLNAGCHAPVGVLAVIEGDRMSLRCRVLALDGQSEVQGMMEGPPTNPEGLGSALAADLLSRGAERFLVSPPRPKTE